ncbi:MAG: anthranilate synthase component I family protein [Methanospirillum sp.]
MADRCESVPQGDERSVHRPDPGAQRSDPARKADRSAFEAAVSSARAHVRAGDCLQVVVSRRIDRPFSGDPLTVYRALRSRRPGPYLYLVEEGDRAVVGASPEMLLRVEGRRVTTVPIAGTRPRGATPGEDAALATELLADEKERAEHLMLVDLARNDLGRIAETGSVAVGSFMEIERYSHVQHLVSTVTATLRDDCDQFDALAACFPAGTVSGAPKLRAMSIIETIEPTPRGVYAGAVGYLDLAGTMDLAIAIRTAVLRDGVASVQVGAGIVADSVPAREYDETDAKALGVLSAIDAAEARP